jgi:hypothetical protein
MLSMDNALQILLIADHICDWARDIFRPNILRCLSGRDDILRDETPTSTYREDLDFNLTATIPTRNQESSTLGSLNSITRRTHSLSLDPVLGESFTTSSHELIFEDVDGHTDATLNDDDHPYLRFSRTDDNLPPWRQNATIRHSNMVLFTFHILAIPEEPSHITKVLESLGGESGLDLLTTCSHFLELLEDDQSVTVTMNAIYQLENMWTERAHRLTSLADYPVRARVLFHTYLREDWQVVREIHCIVASRFAILALMNMTSTIRSSTLNSGMLPDMTLGTAGIRALRCFSGSDSLASALGAAYLRVGTEPSYDVTSSSSWVLRSLNKRSSLFDLEKKLAYKQALNPTSLKFEAVQRGFNVPGEVRNCYGSTSKMDRTGAVLVKKPLSWTADAPEFCLIVLDDTSFTDLIQLGQRLSEVCGAQNIYVPGVERENRMPPLSDIDQIGILRWIEILSGRLPEDSPWLLE